MTKQYASINDLPKKFTMTEFDYPTVYTVTIEDGKAKLTWKDYGNEEGTGYETQRILRCINGGDWKIIDILEPTEPKLKLPLSIKSGETPYVMAAGRDGYVTLVHPNTGIVYADHVTVETAIRFLSSGTWKVVGDNGKETYENIVKAARKEVERLEAELAAAKLKLEEESAELANMKPSYLV